MSDELVKYQTSNDNSMTNLKLDLHLVPILVFLCAGCSSSMITYQNPIVKKAGEYQAAVMYSNTESLEAQGTVGLGCDMDMTLKLDPMPIIISFWKWKNLIPFDLNVKYQLMSKPLYVAAGVGGSRLVLTGGEVGQTLLNARTYRTSSMGKIFVLTGNENVYCGYQLNYVFDDAAAIQFGREFQYDMPAHRPVGSILLGASIGKAMVVNPELHLISFDSRLQIIWGIGLEYSMQ